LGFYKTTIDYLIIGGKQSRVGDCPTTRGDQKTTIVASIVYDLTGHDEIVAKLLTVIVGVREPARSSSVSLVRESGAPYHARAGSTRTGGDLANLPAFVLPTNV
jgi:hypothetical protein